ncbi:MAG: SGNH/GDSL hydrolase family protein [Verrucomicrobiales bacterium]|jgi:lysophospholipase L1-like esterase|nr:SGNH/GDSL hydrolase family protein [Verrucomicrobiales bacterium]
MIKKLRLFILCFTALTVTAAAEGDTHAALPDGVRRVVFLGDSITSNGGYIIYIDDYFATRVPGAADVEFLNLGVASETLSGLSEANHAGGAFPRPDLAERLARVLDATKPDLVFLPYGVNDGIYQPLDADRFQKFKDGMTRTHEECEKRGIRVIHLTPAYDAGRNPAYGAVMAEYSKWLLGQRQRGWQVIDVFAAMNAALESARKDNPDFKFANDGVHPNEAGHWVMARAVLEGLGAGDVAQFKTGEEMARAAPNGEKILQLVRQRQGNLHAAWLRETRHLRPGEPGYKFETQDAEKKGREAGKQIEKLLQEK